jgi:ornithine carbamoyltransferase
MHPAYLQGLLPESGSPSDEVQQALLERARALQHGVAHHAHLLTGKRLGLISDKPQGEDAQLFKRAAQELGAHVSLIPLPVLHREGRFPQLDDIGRMLGLLYDAVECQGLNPESVRRMAVAGDIPMFSGLTKDDHWLPKLATTWYVAASISDRRRWLIQAFLLAILG